MSLRFTRSSRWGKKGRPPPTSTGKTLIRYSSMRRNAGVSLYRRQRGGEHNLRERPPDRGEFERRVVERRVLVGGLPVQHGFVQPSSKQMDSDLAYLVGGQVKDFLVRCHPVEGPVRPDDVAV